MDGLLIMIVRVAGRTRTQSPRAGTTTCECGAYR
jgi:hypothetical protein